MVNIIFQSQEQTQRQGIKQICTREQIQFLKILQLPLLALKGYMQNEAKKNPLLEIEDDMERDVLQISREGECGNLGGITDEFLTYFSQPVTRKGFGEYEDDWKQKALANVAAKSISLHEYLFEQISIMELSSPLNKICENIICNINNSGYLSCSPDEILKSQGLRIQLEQVNKALNLIQGIDPPGIGARNLRECLMLQLDAKGNDLIVHVAKQLVTDYLEEIGSKEYSLVAKNTGYPLTIIRKAVDLIKTLDPMPGSAFNNEKIPYVIPVIKVEKIDGMYEVILLENKILPRVCINSTYRDMLKGRTSDQQTIGFIRENIKSARWFIDAIERRRNTLYKIAVKIVEMQKEFLDEGVFYLKPVTMQEVANTIGVSASTISRAVDEKYMQTPQGIFPMRFFFTGGIMNTNGTMESWETIKQKIARIITQENKSNPLSDDEIAIKMGKEMGIKMARRTITKYRKSMEIPSSWKRRDT